MSWYANPRLRTKRTTAFGLVTPAPPRGPGGARVLALTTAVGVLAGSGAARPAGAQSPAASSAPAPVGFRSGLTQGAGVTEAWVVEGGTSATAAPGAAGATTWRAGELLLHVPARLAGLPRVELRLGAGSYRWQQLRGADATSVPAPQVAGREDASVGVMVDLRRGAAAAPSVADRLTLSLSGDAVLPTGDTPGRDRAWRPVGKLLAGLPVTNRTALAASAGAAVSGPPAAHYTQGFASLWAAHRWTGRLGSYVETLAQTRPAWDGGRRAVAHGGLTVLLAPASHMDVHVGAPVAGPVRGARGAFGGIGLMQRL